MSFMIEHNNLGLPPDPLAHLGVWSPPNSRANFCEEDYVITFVLAEFVNSLTNLAYVVFALRYMYGPRSGGLFRPKWDFMSVALLGLGIGSFLFHASLRQTLEFADELSMLGLTWSMIQATYTTGQSQSRSRLISAALTAFYLPFSAFYVWSPRIVYQVTAFTGALVLVGLRTHYLVHGSNAGFSKAMVRGWTVRAWKATAISLTGYLLWNIENKFCAELRVLKTQVGLPWAWLLEFHGWWHVLTAVGASKFMDVAREVKAEVGRRKKE